MSENEKMNKHEIPEEILEQIAGGEDQAKVGTFYYEKVKQRDGGIGYMITFLERNATHPEPTVFIAEEDFEAFKKEKRYQGSFRRGGLILKRQK